MTAPVVVDVEVGDLEKATETLLVELDDELAEALKRGAWIVANHAKDPQNHDYQDRTGNLTQSIRADDPKGSFINGNLTIDFVAGGMGMKYASYIEFGTKHIRERRFMRDAVDAKTDSVRKQVQQAFDDVISRAGFGP